MINADGSGNKEFVGVAELSWSPNNQIIAYFSTDNCGIIRTMHPDGTDRRFYGFPGSHCWGWLRWSPDSSQLAFADLFNWENAASSIWVMNHDGTNLHRIYQFVAPLKTLASFDLEWSPDGKLVGVWFRETDKNVLQGFLVEATGNAKPQPIDWPMPVWWTPSFWPQWGLAPSSP